MSATALLTLVDGVRIVVPDSLDLITAYVLKEQQDWFEDEIKFVRRLLQQGDHVMDIGANYGVYALSMARAVGPAGRVWAFEPASATADLLAAGISANGFQHVVLERCAVSSTIGMATLSLQDNAELNALAVSPSDVGRSEEVPLITLDAFMEHDGLQHLDFLKIDAEGEEANILIGGSRFFSELSPLVQYEVKAGAVVHTELAENFESLGYQTYRLVPALNMLVPFPAGSTPDPYLLNLFSCKPDRARRLADRGFLLLEEDPAIASEPQVRRAGLQRALSTGHHDWRHTLARLPFGEHLSTLWRDTVNLGNSEELLQSLSLHELSRDQTASPSERFAALTASLELLQTLCERDTPFLRLACLARVAADCGERELAVKALQQLSMQIMQQQRADPSEPFLVPGVRFESLIPRDGAVGNWILASVLEELERLESYSSFYTGTASLQRLELIAKLGYGDEEMACRLRLVQERFGHRAPQSPSRECL